MIYDKRLKVKTMYFIDYLHNNTMNGVFFIDFNTFTIVCLPIFCSLRK